MDEKERVEKDIEAYKELRKKVGSYFKDILEHADRYYEDTVFYYKKQDYFTAFGCINYAYGLVEAVWKIEKEIKPNLSEGQENTGENSKSD